jgi:hypothetical protein
MEHDSAKPTGNYEEELTKKDFDKFEFSQFSDNILLCLDKKYTLQCYDLFNDFSLIKEIDLNHLSEKGLLEISSISCFKLVNVEKNLQKSQVNNYLYP